MKGRIKIIQAIILTTLCVGCIVSYLLLANPIITKRLNNFVYDYWLSFNKTQTAHPKPAIIDIDDKSLQKAGQLPWSRTLLAELLTTLLYQSVSAIGLDVWLTETDRSSPIAVDGELEKNFGINLDLSKLPANVLDNDRYFRDQIGGKAVIIGALASCDEANSVKNLPKSLNIHTDEDPVLSKENIMSIKEAKGLLSPLPIFSDVLPVGILNVDLDEDGVVRSIPMLIRVDDKIYPSLALQTLMVALGKKSIELKKSEDGVKHIIVGDYEIPISEDGTFYPNYLGPAGTYPHYSAIDILEGRVGSKELANKILFISPTAHALNTMQSSPLDPELAETEIHATIVGNILSGSYIRIPPHSDRALIASAFFAALIGSVAFYLFPLPIYTTIGLASLALYIWTSWYFFQSGIFLSPVGPVLALLFSAVIVLPYRYWEGQAEKRKLKNAFNKYVSPEIVSKIISEGAELLKGEQKEATILFTDVRGFTSFSENLAPTKLVRLLNMYFTPMTACVTAHHGTLDKFIGDALMAFWNAPISVERHSLNAVLAALDMHEALKRLRPSIYQEFGIDLKMGIGINTGLVHVGNMGSDDLMNYTCIGDNVNLASRLEGMCKRYGMDIVVSASVKKACELELEHLLLDRIAVKGRSQALEIYAPLNPAIEDKQKLSELWHKGMELYLIGNFKTAYDHFSLLAQYSLLNTAALLFMERCQNLLKEYPKDWDGVWRYKDK